jgi:CPA2 family monovalent cation:H+ antiporter-2
MNSALAIIICALTALICRRFNFPTIPIYILLGLISGGLGFVVDETSEFLSKLGVVLLLFYIGLEIEPKALVQRGREIAVSGF